MPKKTVSGLILALLLMGILAFNIQPAKALTTIYEVIYIRADGSIEPSDAPIRTDDNVVYTLTDDISSYALDYGIVIERNNIIFDGQNHTVDGNNGYIGIFISEKSNVTIKNATIKKFFYGIYFERSSNSSITGNKITNNLYGIYLYYSSNNTINENKITNNTGESVWLDYSSSNAINGNNITNNNGVGIRLEHSSYNIISGNNVTDNKDVCVQVRTLSSNNTIYNNNFVNNAVNMTKQANADEQPNFWDNGTYGNYWSDYTGWDGTWILGFITGKDGIGDQPYVISTNNKDRYPPTTRDPPPDITQIAIVTVIVIAILGVIVFIRRRKKRA